jgi:hypothetical protein
VKHAAARLAALVGTAAALLVPAANAQAAQRYPNTPVGVFQDCENNGALTQTFPESVLARTLAELKTQALQYSDCADVIRAAELAGIAPGTTTTTTTTSTSSAAASGKKHHHHHGKPRRRIRSNPALAANNGARKVRIDGKVVEPGTIELRSGSIVGALPGSLIAVLVLLAVAAAALGGRAARNHARARRPQ